MDQDFLTVSVLFQPQALTAALKAEGEGLQNLHVQIARHLAAVQVRPRLLSLPALTELQAFSRLNSSEELCLQAQETLLREMLKEAKLAKSHQDPAPQSQPKANS